MGGYIIVVFVVDGWWVLVYLLMVGGLWYWNLDFVDDGGGWLLVLLVM